MSGRAVVLGAGISGLAAATALRAGGWDVTVLEEADRPGGCLVTREHDGFRAELGPATALGSQELDELAVLAGLEGSFAAVTPRARTRWVLRERKLVPLPASPREILSTPLLTGPARLRLLAERWLPASRRGRRETVREFFQRRFGRTAGAIVAELAVVGVYAGEPAELLVEIAFPRLAEAERRHGSLLAWLRAGGAARRAIAPRDGWQEFAARLAAPLRISYGRRVTRVESDGRRFRVHCGDGATDLADRVVSTLPAATAARVLVPLGETRGLTSVPHAPVVVATLGWSGGVELPDGFGFLVPATEGGPLLGCVYSSRLVPAAVPPGGALATLMLGGRRGPEVVRSSDDEVEELARSRLREHLGIDRRPDLFACQRWDPGLPQPTHEMVVARAEAADLERRHPGLRVIGSWRSGVSIGDCVAAGLSVTAPRPPTGSQSAPNSN